MRISRTFTLFFLGAVVGCSQHTAAPPLPAVQGISARTFPATGGYKVLYSFKGNPDGQNPYAGMVAVNGALYGTTELGGKYDFGVLYKVSTSGAEQVLHTFGNASTGDGSEPYGTPIVLNGALYGTTYYGGRAPADYGTVYKASTAGSEHILCSFTQSEGEFPYAGVADLNGTLYGTTYQGGEHGYGTVYGCTMAGKVRVLHSFELSPDGAYPFAPPVALDGTLYGTTYQGGSKESTYGYGIVYKVTTAGAEHVLHTFADSPGDGAYPHAGLRAINGKLYGTTSGGGTYGSGAVYDIAPSGAEHVIYSFKGGSDGAGPNAGVVVVNGTLYGTTSSGGQDGQGTVYKVTTAGKEQILHSFTGVAPDGSEPLDGLVSVNGTLYGTTFYGGSHDDGVVFKVTP